MRALRLPQRALPMKDGCRETWKRMHRNFTVIFLIPPRARHCEFEPDDLCLLTLCAVVDIRDMWFRSSVSDANSKATL